MTVHPSQTGFKTAHVDVHYEHFACHRSKLIDAFGELELVVREAANRFLEKPLPFNAGFSQQIDALAKVKASPKLSKANAEILHGLPRECERLKSLRGYLVHAVMELGNRGGEPVAMFHNVAEKANGIPNVAVLTDSDFIEWQTRVRNVTNKLSAMLRPARPEPT